MTNNILFNVFVFLAAASLVVPLANRFKLGSVLGYLTAGVMIGPFGFSLIANSSEIMQFGQFGVIMMLFLIGLSLDPQKLWHMRKSIIGLGSLQVLLTTALLTLLGYSCGYSLHMSIVCGMALSLSSTALVLQILHEKNLLRTTVGEISFSVLLFQDIAVIPILLIMHFFKASTLPDHSVFQIDTLAGWVHAGIIFAVIASVVVSGRYFSHTIFYFVAKSKLREIFTATSLAIIVGVTLLMGMIGVSPALGAFVAGLVLANSEYKQTLESDIEPFKGLLLGLFFISVGMGMDLSLFAAHTQLIILMVVGLITVKTLVLFFLAKKFGIRGAHKIGFALALSQGSEFAFVLFQYANVLHIINHQYLGLLGLAVAISMAVTPLLLMFYNIVILPRYASVRPEPVYDEIHNHGHPVVVVGYGRFGQIIGRFLISQHVPVIILDNDADQIERLRRFGVKAHFGDATRLDILRGAVSEDAKILVVAIDDEDKTVEVVRLARATFPKLKIFARARNRRHAYELDKAGVDYFRRETFDSSLNIAKKVMSTLGFPHDDIVAKSQRFMHHDEKMLKNSFAYFDREEELISFYQMASRELEEIMQAELEEKPLQG